MICSHPKCERNAQSKLPLVVDGEVKGELPVCHDAAHMVWGGCELGQFEKMDDKARERFLKKYPKSTTEELSLRGPVPSVPRLKKQKKTDWRRIRKEMRGRDDVDF